MPCCAVSPDTGMIEVPDKDQGLLTWDCSYLSREGLVHSVFLVGQLAGTHYNVNSPYPPFNPDPWVLSHLLMYHQAKLHALQLVIDTEG